MDAIFFPQRKRLAAVFLSAAFLLIPRPGFSQAAGTPEKKDETEKAARITEEILVIGKSPKELPVATVSSMDSQAIRLLKPRNLADVIKFAPGAYVSVGSKEEHNLRLRGFDNKRIALLVDGVPVIDPYYSSFDLKTVAAGGLESVQVTKGPSSVLYGPNTLGGIVNVITRRPGAGPRLSLDASYGDNRTRAMGFDGSRQWNKVGLVGSAYYQDSKSFSYKEASGQRRDRYNTDYERLNLNAKVYYVPSSRSEFMLNAGYYTSEYGMPPDLTSSKPRYWHFKDWSRFTLNAGGFTALGDKATLRFRAFYVKHDNTLDQYKDKAMTVRQFESTFDNAVSGLFGIGDFSLASWNSLKVSLYYQKDHVRIQDDVNLPWDEFDQGTFSAGIEDHVSLHEDWKLIGGLSVDYLDKITGENKTRVNPLVGLKYSPSDELDIHVSFAGKSRFPSMRSLYSTSSGNPDLLSERATTWEVGAAYNAGWVLKGAVFFSDMKNMIDSYLLTSGLRRYMNIGHARLNGAEIGIQKTWDFLRAAVNYTYMDHRNLTDNRPLDTVSDHNLNFCLDINPVKNLHLGLFGLFASKSYWYDFNNKKLLEVPSWKTLDVSLTYALGGVEPYIRMTNAFDRYYYTEPGFPWRGRYLEIGIRADVFSRSD